MNKSANPQKRPGSDGMPLSTKRLRATLPTGSLHATRSLNDNVAGGLCRWQRLDAYQRHKLLVNQYLLTEPGSAASVFERDTSNDVSDFDIVKRHYRFVMEDASEATSVPHVSSSADAHDHSELLKWEKQIALKYYKRLHQEYCIVDLTLYKTNQIGMRWRTEREVMDGKGQFICGNRKCMVGTSADAKLQSWEVNFAYFEKDDAGAVAKKNALVKVRLCDECSAKLNHNKRHRRCLPSQIMPSEPQPAIEQAEYATPARRVQKDRVAGFASDAGISAPSLLPTDSTTSTSKPVDSSHKCGSANADGESVDTDVKKYLASNPETGNTEQSREKLMDSYLNDLFL